MLLLLTHATVVLFVLGTLCFGLPCAGRFLGDFTGSLPWSVGHLLNVSDAVRRYGLVWLILFLLLLWADARMYLRLCRTHPPRCATIWSQGVTLALLAIAIWYQSLTFRFVWWIGEWNQWGQ